MRALAACAVLAVSLYSTESDACGCFASTTVTDPVVQAGERILFATEGDKVTAYVQIQYQGSAADFGWLLPLPSVPEVKVGTDELFEVLDQNTAPRFALTTTINASCQRSSGPVFGCAGAPLAASAERGAGADGGTPGRSPLVLRDTVGPYDYAVLKADSMSDVKTWLDANHFFVPSASGNALAPYLRPNAYFLALKLRSGQSAGSLKPVVLTYTAQYPMIPLQLTAATAVPNMGVLVFVLGSSRAVPRNYHHVELNLLKLDWSDASNYQALVTQAVGEAPDRHAFVTEYAGPDPARGQLVADGRFGDPMVLRSRPDAVAFVHYLYANGYAPLGKQDLSDALLDVLETQIPAPPKLLATGVARQQFFRSLSGYLAADYQAAHPEQFEGWPGVSYDGAKLGDAVWSGFAQPARDAEVMLGSHPYLTRMFTTLSPEDMTKDPAFGFNPSLPDVGALVSGTRTTGCSGVPTTLEASGYTADDSQLTPEKKDAMPAAAVVEQLPEEGSPVIESHYLPDRATAAAPARGCAVADGAFMAFLGALWLIARRRKIS